MPRHWRQNYVHRTKCSGHGKKVNGKDRKLKREMGVREIEGRVVQPSWTPQGEVLCLHG